MSVVPLATPRSWRRTLTAAFAAALALAGVGAVGAAPAQAADGHLAVSVTPSGPNPLSDLGAAGAGKYTVDAAGLVCPSAAYTPASVYLVPGALTSAFQLPGPAESWIDFAPDGTLVSNTAVPGTDEGDWPNDTYTIQATTAVFPVPGAAGWTQLAPTVAPATLVDAVKPGTYTFVVACDDGGNDAIGDENNRAIMAWSYLVVTDSTWEVVDTPPVATVATTTAVSADPATHKLTATVTAASGSTAPTGKIQFSEGATALTDPVTLSPGTGATATASYTPSAAQLSVGAHTFTATYQPADSGFGPSNGSVPVTISAPAAAATVVTVHATLTSDGTGANLTATVTAGGSTATAATGTVQFYADGTGDDAKLGAAVAADQGVATTTATDLAAGDHTFTAVYTPDTAGAASYQSSPMSDPSNTVTVAGDDAQPLTGGMTVTAGAQYVVEYPDGTFQASETVDGVVHSDPVDVGSVTASAAGAVTFAFTMPAGLAAGTHTLELTGATGGHVEQVSFVVAAAAGDPDNDNVTPNDPVRFLTDWVGHTTSTPAGAAGLFTALVLTLGAGVGAWLLFWKRRSASRA